MATPREPMRSRAALLLALLCGPATPETGHAAGADWRLRQGLASCGELVLQTADGPDRPQGALCERLRRASGLPVEVAPLGSPLADGAARLVLGTVRDDALRALLAARGVDLAGDGFALAGRRFSGPGDGLSATFEDPARPGQPLTLLCANTAQGAAALAPLLAPGWRSGWRVFAAGELELEGGFVPGPAGDPVPVVDTLGDHGAARDALEAGFARSEGPGLAWSFAPAIPAARREAYAASVGAARQRVVDWLGAPPAEPLGVVAHAQALDLAHASGEAELATIAPGAGVVRALLEEGVPDDGGQAAARALSRAIAGDAASPWLADGVAVAAAGSWYGRPLDVWVGQLAASGLALAVGELVDPDAARSVSPHRLLPLRAALVETLLARDGADRLRQLWSGAGALDADALGAALETRLAALAATWGRSGRSTAERARQAALGAPTRRGAALLAQPLPGPSRRFSGYLAPAAGEALTALRAAGADAFSLTVFASATEHEAWEERVGVEGPVRASASDLALLRAVAVGRALGLRPMLVLEALARPGSTRADAVAMLTPGDWSGFFRTYTICAEHYALVAELAGCELYCFGLGLRVAADPTRDVDPRRRAAKEQGWRETLASLRRAFPSGALTYAADLGAQSDDVPFWGEVDFVGLNVFPDQAIPEGGGRDDARAAYADALEEGRALARRWGRPALWVQVGFPSAAEAGLRPRVPRGAPDPALQLAAFGGLVDALRAGSEDLAGLYLWYWPTERAAGGAGDRGYAPLGKPAAGLLGELFSAR